MACLVNFLQRSYGVEIKIPNPHVRDFLRGYQLCQWKEMKNNAIKIQQHPGKI